MITCMQVPKENRAPCTGVHAVVLGTDPRPSANIAVLTTEPSVQSSAYFLRWGVSSELKLGDAASLAGQQIPQASCLSSSQVMRSQVDMPCLGEHGCPVFSGQALFWLGLVPSP